MNRSEKAEALSRFLSIHPGMEADELAKKICIDRRTMERLLKGETSMPNEKTALRMNELYAQTMKFAQMSEDELSDYAETLRVHREKWQRQIELKMTRSSIPVEMPPWFEVAARMVERGSYDEARDLMLTYVENTENWNSVLDDTKPHVLCYLSMCCYYTGRVNDAISFLEMSEKSNIGNNFDLKKVIHTNMASYLFRIGNSEGAISNIEKALDVDPGYVNPLLTVFCICEKSRNHEMMIRWIGRAHECAKRDFSREDLETYISMLETDPDLTDWTRSHSSFIEFMADLNNLFSKFKTN